MRRVRVRLGNNRVEQHQRMANCASTDGSGRTDRAGWLQTGRQPEPEPQRARGLCCRELMEASSTRICSNFCRPHFHSHKQPKAGIAIAASAQTLKVWLLQRVAFVLHQGEKHESRSIALRSRLQQQKR